ncbi:MAG: putative toxin-antitoxin system toxin component, PIN family [Nitrospira sp.]|nr:putative toxin-antitoxin system toxin component, PIN family [Nitrospira sp.]MDH4371116.1 putative toxin-antitoxin system toxin component, PIN family [Nitrospira sp.]MDH5348307.1 putative toxin-antitoxin system toxin component, PIN family [Nitrospira sp.]MDH5498367.1 putative toxin-antitoxin system toxin component, PIN family [Nitrospira sp.]MDH5726260.1 putative toxin-antitoxin system toxin component, PIN family [Nitrospira sp.]
MRVVFDTNITISALALPGGSAEAAYLKAIRGEFELFTSVAILTETARVLQTKFDWAEGRVRQAVQEISQTATVLRPRPSLHILKDEPDNRILECAMAAQADWIISGDSHLLALKRHASTAIMSLADFLAGLQK